MESPLPILTAAEQVAGILERHRVGAVVIGAVALAAYHYVRQTHDVDIGVNADVPTLRNILISLQHAGFSAELREPDLDDPLGGVIDITGDFGLLQVISFAGRFPAVIEDAIHAATLVVRPGSPLKLIPLPHLVALKLYAGGLRSKADILELLRHNPDTNLDEIRAVCDRYRLRGLNAVLAELR